ncbi:YciI family protein [Hyalangium rubrum]|uniref:YciI family protein n=1 Tax=Hyalangium rubrum TaxID=3103134 RepID=A0ABU5H090_9BACT|nr:YciI family protein [Hyalangium sp. s54d21]MDY7226865.1 YciI family protein [Hyalangium sp. s54d21]
MRSTLFLCLFALLTGCATGKAAQAQPPEPPREEFKMRTYYMAFLRRGPAWSAERTPEAVAAGEGHMANIHRLAACGKLLIAGPFDVGANPPKDALAGLFIFDVQTMEEAVALTQTDPAVKAGRFTIEVMPWYGPAGLTYTGHPPPAPGAKCEP